MADQSIDYEALARRSGAISSKPAPIDYEALAKQEGASSSKNAPTPAPGGSKAPWEESYQAPEQKSQSGPMQAAGNFIGGLWKNVNPITAIGGLIPSMKEMEQNRNDVSEVYQKGDYLGAAGKAIGGAIKSTPPYRLASGIIGGAVDQGKKAAEAFQQGRYSEAAGHGVAAAVPVLGPTLANAGERIGGNVPMPPGKGTQLEGEYRSPDPAGGLGEVAGMAAPAFAGKLNLGPKASTLKGMAERHYQGALKPVTGTPRPRVDSLVKGGLDYEIPVNAGGRLKNRTRIDEINNTVDTAIQNAKGATVDPANVAAETNRSMKLFDTGMSSDQAPVIKMRDEFLNENPNPIPIDKAQEMKRANYRMNKDAYGEQGVSTRETRKDIARGLKNGVYDALPPEIKLLGPEEGVRIDLEKALDRYANRHGNRDMMGIGTPIAATAIHAATGSGAGAVAGGLIKAAMEYPAIKSRIAIALSKAAKRKATGISTPIAAPLTIGTQIANGQPQATSEE